LKKDYPEDTLILIPGIMETTAKTSTFGFLFYFWLLLMGIIFILSGVLG
jgi:hypothetical protein